MFFFHFCPDRTIKLDLKYNIYCVAYTKNAQGYRFDFQQTYKQVKYAFWMLCELSWTKGTYKGDFKRSFSFSIYFIVISDINGSTPTDSKTFSTPAIPLRGSLHCVNTSPSPFCLIHSLHNIMNSRESESEPCSIISSHCWTLRTERSSTPVAEGQDKLARKTYQTTLCHTHTHKPVHWHAFSPSSGKLHSGLFAPCLHSDLQPCSFLYLINGLKPLVFKAYPAAVAGFQHPSTRKCIRLIKILFRATIHKGLFTPRTKRKNLIKSLPKGLFASRPKK